MKVQVEHEITGQRIADVMTTAIESGDPVTRSWVGGIHLLDYTTGEKKGDDPWYADSAIWDGNFKVQVTEIDDDTSEEAKHIVGPGEMVKGLQVMATKFPDTLKRIVDEEDSFDAGDADLFLQCICFAEEKYA